MTVTERAEVLVIGAGLAGLSAARTLRATGVSSIVLDARLRVGGRVHSDLTTGTPLELGGEFIGPTQHSVLDLADELGIELFETYNNGDVVFEPELGKVTTFPAGAGMVPPLEGDVAADVLRCVVDIDELHQSFTKDVLFNDRIPPALSGSFGRWLDGRTNTALGRRLVEYVVRGLCSAEVGQISLASVIRKLATAGDDEYPASVARVIATDQGAQMYRVRHGSHRIIEAMSEQIADVIRLGSPVRQVLSIDGHVRVTTVDGVEYEGDRAIVAMPPTLIRRLDFGGDAVGLANRFAKWRAGDCMKVLTVYDEPFWRADGLSGSAISPGATAESVYDNSPCDTTQGVLLSFIKGSSAAALRNSSQDEVLGAVREDLVRMFGASAAKFHTAVVKQWNNDAWAAGCPCSYIGEEDMAAPGEVMDASPMWKSESGLHFAAAEFSKQWSGYMSGAIGSGQRAAEEVTASQ